MADLADESNKSFHIIAYGSWYGEDLAYLNESDANYNVPLYPTGMGYAESVILGMVEQLTRFVCSPRLNRTNSSRHGN